MGLGFTVGLTFIGSIREIIGAGTIFGLQIMPASYEPVTIFILAPGAFFVLAFLVAAMNKLQIGAARRGIDKSDMCIKSGGCAGCSNKTCSGKMAELGNK